AVGAALHATWLVNPLRRAFTAWPLYRFAAAAFGEGPGRASALLFALSPFVLIMGASEMNHVGALALATLALAALPTWATGPRGSAVLGAAALIGLGVGGMATIRPLDAAVVAIVIGVFQLSVLRRERSRARYLFEWPLPGLVPILAALVALRRPTRWDLLLLGLIGATVGAYGLYWAADSFFAGPRFLYTAVPAFVIFGARAPGLAAESLPQGVPRRATLLVVPLCLCYAWLTPTGVSSVQMRAYYYHVGRT